MNFHYGIFAILAITMTVVTLMLTPSIVNANKGGEPPVHVGNPNDLSVGPPVPSCNAFDQGNHHGNPDDTREGCKTRGN